MTPESAKDAADKVGRYFQRLESEQPGKWRTALSLAERLVKALRPTPERQELMAILSEIDALAAKEGIGTALNELKIIIRSVLRGLP